MLFQLRVFGFGFLQDGDVGVGVFPQRDLANHAARSPARSDGTQPLRTRPRFMAMRVASVRPETPSFASI